jgi:hypothetical protein
MSLSVLFVQSIYDILPALLYFVLANLFITLFYSWHQWTLTKTQIKELGIKEEGFLHVKLFSETFYSYGVRASIPHGATLYIFEQFIFIRPRPGDWYSGIYRANLPIVFTRDQTSLKELTTIKNIYSPLSIQPGKDTSIEIVFRNNPASSAKTTFYIEFCQAADYDKIKSYFFKALD